MTLTRSVVLPGVHNKRDTYFMNIFVRKWKYPKDSTLRVGERSGENLSKHGIPSRHKSILTTQGVKTKQ